MFPSALAWERQGSSLGGSTPVSSSASVVIKYGQGWGGTYGQGQEAQTQKSLEDLHRPCASEPGMKGHGEFPVATVAACVHLTLELLL